MEIISLNFEKKFGVLSACGILGGGGEGIETNILFLNVNFSQI